MNNTVGTLFGHSRSPGHRTTTGVMAAEKAASMQPVDELVVLLGRGSPAASMNQRCGLAHAGPVPCD